MALTGLDIFKLLPKTNCRKCGMPTCLAFAMQLAQKKTSLDKCPDVSEQAKQALTAAAAPPMRHVCYGVGEHQVELGQETVLFRHEEKFYRPTAVGATVSDAWDDDAITQRVAAINALQFERVGQHLAVNTLAVVCDSGRPERFAEVATTVQSNSSLALVLVAEDAEALSRAAAATAAGKPLLAAATQSNAEAVAAVAKQHGCPLVVRAADAEALAELTETVKALGVEDLVLWFDASVKEQLYGLSRARILALKKGFRPLGYPTFARVQGDPDDQIADATALICKYAGVVLLDRLEAPGALALLSVVLNLYSDPQKPIQVESKLYRVGEPDETSPVLFTTNFSLTYYSVESDVEASRVPAYILVVDTEGTSVLTAYSGDKLNEQVVAQALAKNDVENLVSHRKIIIPGYVAVMSGKLEEATGWEVLVGPRESSMLPKFLQEVWAA